MSCSNCGRTKVVLRGLCRPCYDRLKRTGVLTTTPKKKGRDQCTFDGCEALQIARGLCEAHYRIQKRYGDVLSPFGYGERQAHPNYGAWCYQIRVKEGRVKEWDNFWQFVGDVGDRPTNRTQAKRLVGNEPWGPNNFRWHEPIGSTADAKQYQKVWRAANPLKAKGQSLKRNYGVTIEQYAAMYDAQKGKCAICGTHGASYDRKDGRTKTLVLDHCHTRKKTRALLCPDCNKGLGIFKDSVSRLHLAITYLMQHQ